MKELSWILLLFMLVGCASEELSMISIRNETDVPIYTQPFSSEFSDGDWILPGAIDEFYSINCDCLDGFEYFSFYYDSLIIFMQDNDEDPIKFYQDGTTINYDPTLNPFTNPDVWRIREFDNTCPGASFSATSQEQHVSDHYFCIDSDYIKSLADTVLRELNPAP